MQWRDDITCVGKYAADKVGLLSGRIEVTSACYQHCKLCDSWRDHQSGKVCGSWALADIQELVAQALAFPHFQFLGLTGGDPQAWPELNSFLEWVIAIKHQLRKRQFVLQIDTSLQKQPAMGIWRGAVDRVRVSLDAIDPKIYRLMRGNGSPEAVLEHMAQFDGVDWSTITTICEENLCEVPAILSRLEKMVSKGLRFRKAMFLAAIDHRKSRQDDKFWKVWHNFEQIKTSIPTSFVGESVREVRAFCKSADAKDVRCWVPNMSFYAKANGAFYPCCLIGGEAVQTREEFCMGNFKDHHSLRRIWDEYEPPRMYLAKSACRGLCQFKQANLNYAAEKAAQTIITMP
jgi:MoaA/NifB/PqqE/SkfB family radical SAM enzyme